MSDILVLPPPVPGQPGKFKVGKVADTSIELTWEPAYTKEGIVNYELLYKPVKFGSLVRPFPLTLFFCTCVQGGFLMKTGGRGVRGRIKDGRVKDEPWCSVPPRLLGTVLSFF